ncbi:MAG: UDP-N-acetylmuramoyl-L-alanine--D-glutamate ligase [Candidatus Hydrogenedentes bacterium]|nr:UDP-N-acetylmuramoyl-L-alanine--D-glutamate ligase [Candidatus Hydrogenedentota bacterium]
MDIAGKDITIIGTGRTARALARLILSRGGRPFLSDSADLAPDHPARIELDTLGAAYEVGGHTGLALERAALFIPSPGVSPKIPVIAEAIERGIPVMSEMEFAWHFCKARILAVTGTNGKTTTTALLHAMVEACGRSCMLAGNNDLPLSAAVLADPAPEFIVLEVSSYQVELAREFRPEVAAVLNLTPDHLARHGTMENYAAVKQRIFARQQGGDVAVVNADDEWTAGMETADADRRAFSLRHPIEGGSWFDGAAFRSGDTVLATAEDNPLPGRHNIENVTAALTMAHAAGLPLAGVREGLRGFRGVEHRIERVTTQDGIAWYNDSKATNIDSLKVALESFDERVVLIAGGQGKGSDYRVLRGLVGARVKHLVTLGQDAPLLEAAFGDLVPCTRATDMDEAVLQAGEATRGGGTVLLSPACASFDMYGNFEERGRHFKECVRRLTSVTEEAAS